MATIIDGKKIAGDIRAELTREIEALRAQGHAPPGLAVIIVGERKDSQTYVRLKHKAAEECGFRSFQIELPGDITESALVEQVEQCNSNADIHGLIIQLPLPKHINEPAVLAKVAVHKDVDGLGPENISLLYVRGKTPYSYPCTPSGIIQMLERTGIPIEGARAAVIGRSNIVGLPVAHMLLERNATVTICHSKTPDLAAVTSTCDILVVAAGNRELVNATHVKKGAAVIDVGTNCVDDPSKKAGYRTVGDVDFESAKEVAGFISPVPGGVGPMTIAMLLTNTFNAYKRSLSASL